MGFLSRILGSTRREVGPLQPEDLEIWHRVEAALDRVRPMLEADGGNIEVIEITANSVTLKFIGACSHCPSSTVTMREGVERMLREEMPDLNEIRLV
jgi:Fe-S cluster biogenesis protein NfuA